MDSRIHLVAMVALTLAPFGSQAVTVALIAPDGTASARTVPSDAVLGIAGASIESFDSTDPFDGFTVTFDRPDDPATPSVDESSTVLRGSLAAPFDAEDAGNLGFNGTSWDDRFVLVNAPTNTATGYHQNVTFAFAKPVSLFGIGFGEFDFDLDQYGLAVDGVPLGDFDTLDGDGDVFNRSNQTLGGYLLITDPAGFSSVTITTPNTQDGVAYDRLAWSLAEIPAPAAIGLLTLVPLFQRRR